MNHIGKYPADWKAINAAVCEAVGHRCIRCGHPYRKGAHGKGEWTPCDEKCTHGGPTRDDRYSQGEAQWRILTVHHFDGNKSHCQWFNLLALCQRCHLQIQGKVDPDIPYFLEHSPWIKPYVAGWYAQKYLGETLTRKEVAARLDELLALELKA